MLAQPGIMILMTATQHNPHDFRGAEEAAETCWNEVPEGTHWHDVADYVFGQGFDSDTAQLAAIERHPFITFQQRDRLIEELMS